MTMTPMHMQQLETVLLQFGGKGQSEVNLGVHLGSFISNNFLRQDSCLFTDTVALICFVLSLFFFFFFFLQFLDFI